MKKLSFLILAIFCAGIVNAQNVFRVTKLSAPLDRKMPATDSIFIDEASVIKIEENAGSTATNIEYIDANGEIKTVDVKEDATTSSTTKATFSFTFQYLGDTLDSITINGVTIIRNLTAGINGRAADSVAHYVADSISNFSSSPNYTATWSDSTVTITAAQDSSAASNGFLVNIIYDGTTDVTGGVLSGGIALTSITSQMEKEFAVVRSSDSKTIYLQKDRVKSLVPRNNGNAQGTIIYYDRVRKYTYEVLNKRLALQTTLNAL